MTLRDEIRLLLEAPTMNPHDVRTLLRRDHDEVLQLARDLLDADEADERRRLLRKLRRALAAHSRAEEREVYDALLSGSDGTHAHAMAWEGQVEHGLFDSLLEKMARSRKSDSDEWEAHAKVLLELLEHHIDEEQAGMFGALAEQFDDAERAALGRRFLACRARHLMKAGAA